MSTKSELLKSIASTISDYRHGEIATPDPAHIETWVNQFSAAARLPILNELDYVLKRTYINRATVTKFLAGLIAHPDLTGADPCAFWRGATILNNQGGGNSQKEMLALLDAALRKHCGFGIEDCAQDGATFVYIDDVVYTGNRVLKDVSSWIKSTAPAKAKGHIIAIAFHRGGQHYAKGKIRDATVAASKDVKVTWWRRGEIEDRRSEINNSDVLRPRGLGDDPLVAAYAASLTYKPTFRSQDGIGEHKFFSSEAGRSLLEQEFLKAGVRIRDMCPHLNKYQRPLGNMVLETLGFGSTIVTFRNCPNNAPLALWAGDPWYPLFPRKTN